MTTQSAGRSIAAPRGGRTGGRTGRGGGRTREPTGKVGGRTGDQDGQGGDRGNGANGGVDKSGMTWEDFKASMREEFCPSNEMQKLETEFWCHPMIRRMVAASKPTTIQSVILKAGVLTDEVIRNGSLRENTEKRGNGGEPSKDGNVKDDNKVRPRMVNPLNARNPTAARRPCFECSGTDHNKAACRRLN
ncbi:hypothetical protein Tco_0266706 [Tanacetum coccineum]